MYIVLEPSMISKFQGGLYGDLKLRYRRIEDFEKCLSAGSPFDLRIRNRPEQVFLNVYKDCEIISFNKRYLTVTMRYRKYTYVPSAQIRKEQLLESLKMNDYVNNIN